MTLEGFGTVAFALTTSRCCRLCSVLSVRCGKLFFGAASNGKLTLEKNTIKRIYIQSIKIYIRGGLLFFFLGAALLSFSDLIEAGSDSVGIKYFLPDPLPILSDLGSTTGFFALQCLIASISCLVMNIIKNYIYIF